MARLRPRCRVTWLGNASSLTKPETAADVEGAQVGEHGLAGGRALPLGDERPHAVGEIDVEARAEADHAEALARSDRRALAHLADDASRDQAGDLHHRDAGAA